jgi:hypothetical protein
MKAALARQCAAHRVKHLKLFLDIEIRWNSTYTMLERFLEMESPLRSLLASKDAANYDVSHLALNNDEWAYRKVLCEVFKNYYPVTVKMSAQAYPSLYNVLRNTLHYGRFRFLDEIEGVGSSAGGGEVPISISDIGQSRKDQSLTVCSIFISDERRLCRPTID